MKPAYFEPISQKGKSYSHLTTRQYIVTHLATQLHFHNMQDQEIHKVIERLEKVADRILKG